MDIVGSDRLNLRAAHTLALILILILGAAPRFYGLDWDGGIGAHPDGRYVVGVAEALRWPDRLNPFDIAPDFSYGHLPLYLLALVAHLVGPLRGVDLLLVGRGLAALFDLGTVALTFALGRRVYAGDDCPGEKVGLLAAAFVALAVFHVQQAHFYIADVLLAFFVLGTLHFAVRLIESGRARDAWLAGAWAGLAVGTKFSAVLLMLPLGASLLGHPMADGGRRGQVRGLLLQGLRVGGAALTTFALSNPFALACFPTFWRNVLEQAAIARGTLDVPYTRQFHATWPYLYPLAQQVRWGMGWPLGLVACAGFAWTVWRAVREPPRRGEWVVLAWTVPYFAFVGALYARFPRYLLPLTPLLALYAARLLADLVRGPGCGGWLDAFGYLPLILCCLSLLTRCLAFANLYRVPHPWQVASEWFYEHGRGVVAVEQWDHPLPLDATGYDVRQLPIFDEDTPEKWAVMEEVLAEADYVVIASRRGYGTVAQWPERYPRTARYYRMLFEGDLGFEPVACFGRYPRLGPLALTDDPAAGLDFSLPEMCQPDAPLVLHLGRLDESFVVYDHPWVVILRRVGDRGSGRGTLSGVLAPGPVQGRQKRAWSLVRRTWG